LPGWVKMSISQDHIYVMRLRSLAAICLLGAATGASASVYKVVGPDGRISYTDQPLTAAATNVHVFKAGTARPTSANKAGATGDPAKGASAGSDTVKASQSPASGINESEAAALRAESTALMPAVRIVLGNGALARESMQLCMQAVPGTTRRFEGALEGWKTRNHEAVERAEEVLAVALAPTPRIQFKQSILDQTRQMLRPVREGALARRLAWCEQTTAEIEGGGVDLNRNPAVGQLLRARRH
jgi:hypothetical protein